MVTEHGGGKHKEGEGCVCGGDRADESREMKGADCLWRLLISKVTPQRKAGSINNDKPP